MTVAIPCPIVSLTESLSDEEGIKEMLRLSTASIKVSSIADIKEQRWAPIV